MRPMKSCTSYAECACRSERECIVFVEKVSKNEETSIKKRKTPMLVPSKDILFHKESRKHWLRPAIRPKSQEEVLNIAASRKAEAEAIRCVVAIVTGEERRLWPPLLTIDPIFLPAIEHIGQESDHGFSHKKNHKEEDGNVPWKDLKVFWCYFAISLLSPLYYFFGNDDHLVMQVMTEYNDRLREDERYKAKLKENKQLRLTRWNGENVKLKKLFEATKKYIQTEREVAMQEFLGFHAFHHAFRPHCTREVHFEKRKWMVILERYDNRCIIRNHREEIDEYRQMGETFVLAIDPSSKEKSDDEVTVDEQTQQTQQGEDDLSDAEDGGGTLSDIVRASTSYEDDQ
ncbi:hypothetical protein D8674_004210 [Pyrus ussuriensis x Pyrus communis]|uniref:Uncharacterized protein n=1 Tax=Pyrus ussuriensis x Pyrus communis TaxID=2448454 RepID=A0A5N5FJ87_9ROSA|nr:hypothetical protein D8674_004210 [Pyrus ussuriensis x Pyrus communis]